MLVLSRAIGEVISIGDDIAVHVLSIHGTQVKLGIDAPAGAQVHRAEVNRAKLQRTLLERQNAATHPVVVPNP